MTNRLTFIPTRRATPYGTSTRTETAEHAFDPVGRRRIYWTGSARSALRAILLHLKRTGALPDKNAEILVPRWACTGLYGTIQKIGFPTITDSPSIRGVLVYHQYGFPQHLDRIAQRCRDRGLFLIENNVNCAFSGPPLGGMGEAGMASIFSLPKMFHTTYGGALVTGDSALRAFCDDYFRSDERWIGTLCRLARRTAEAAPGPTTSRLQEMTYGAADYWRNAAPEDIARMRADIAAGCIESRRRNYNLLRKEFSGAPFFEGLEPDAIPFVAPLFGPEDFLKRLAAALSHEGWESGVYHFDAARDVFEPRFVQCVPLPVRHDLEPEEFARLIDIVRREWRAFDGQR